MRKHYTYSYGVISKIQEYEIKKKNKGNNIDILIYWYISYYVKNKERNTQTFAYVCKGNKHIYI